MRPITEKDKVCVHYEYPNASSDITGEVLHTPSDSGDMWYIKEGGTGKIIAVNPQHLYLQSISRLEKGDLTWD